MFQSLLSTWLPLGPATPFWAAVTSAAGRPELFTVEAVSSVLPTAIPAALAASARLAAASQPVPSDGKDWDAVIARARAKSGLDESGPIKAPGPRL